MNFYRQEVTVTDLHVDCFGRLKPSMLLFFAQEMAGKHCTQLHLTWEELAEKGLFWAVVRHKAQVNRLPQRGETITLETWPMPTTRVAYPRAMAAYDAQGQLLFQTVSLWVLMDLNTRAMVLPGKSGVDVEGTQRGTELEPPANLPVKQLPETDHHKVRFSQLDRNGHMNNTRYLDWVDDLLPGSFHEEHPLEEFVICYLNEALEGQHVQLDWELQEGCQLHVNAHREKTNAPGSQERVFSARVVFK